MKNNTSNPLKRNIRSAAKDILWNLWAIFIINPRLPDNPKQFLFICRGNVCRSAFAELFAKKIKERGVLPNDRIFHSSGIEAGEAASSPEESITAAKKFGVNMASHSSRKNTLEMVKMADMILAMDTPTFRSLNRSFPKLRSKIFLLPLFGRDKSMMATGFYRYNIPDPYGKTLDQFDLSYSLIKKALYCLFKALRFTINDESENIC